MGGSGQGPQKHTTFSPARKKLFGFRLRSPLLPSRNHARSAFKRFFQPTGLRQARKTLEMEVEMFTNDNEKLILWVFFFIKESRL
jgi:hypothetical protein